MMNNTSVIKSYYSQRFWNIAFTVLFVALCVWFARAYREELLQIMRGITPFYFTILTLATFRLSRLLVSDHITQWVRDLFVHISFKKDEATGAEFIVRTKPEVGPRAILSQLFGCTWCIGVWAALIVFVCFSVSVGTSSLVGLLVVMVLAVSGAVAILQAVTSKLSTDNSVKKQSSSPNVCTECGLE